MDPLSTGVSGVKARPVKRVGGAVAAGETNSFRPAHNDRAAKLSLPSQLAESLMQSSRLTGSSRWVRNGHS